MKKIICCIMVVLMMLSFVGCKNNEQQEKPQNTTIKFANNIEFVLIKNEGYILDLLVCKQTKVVYLYVNGVNKGALEVLVDENGKPILWEGEL